MSIRLILVELNNFYSNYTYLVRIMSNIYCTKLILLAYIRYIQIKKGAGSG